MAVRLDAAARELIVGRPLTALTTLNAAGHPQSTIVFVLRRGDTLLISTITTRRKARSMMRDPRVTPDQGVRVRAAGRRLNQRTDAGSGSAGRRAGRSATITSSTATSTIAPPSSCTVENRSPTTSTPSSTAITGLT
jgi:Pyridoxamine 5'-phosphate oxidase